MKVLNCCTDDWANFSHDNAKALRSVGVDCGDVKVNEHEFNYDSESVTLSRKSISDMMRAADIIQIFHTDVTMLELAKPLNKRIVIYYCDSRYRSNPQKYNAIFNPFVETSIIALGEFAGLGAKNEHYVVGAIDVDNIPKIGPGIKEPYKIGHYPSNPRVKGTTEILQMLNKVKGKFKLHHSIVKVPHPEQQKRINDCDIYIELFKPELEGKKYGSFGMTALEAAAAGKIVITQSLSNNVYEANYGYCPLIRCHSEKSFIDTVNQLLKFGVNHIGFIQEIMAEWVRENHSYEATGKRIKEILKI